MATIAKCAMLLAIKARNTSRKTKGRALGTRIGRAAFAAISAVEGIKLTPEMKRREREFDRKGLSPEERIKAIVAVHRKAPAVMYAAIADPYCYGLQR